MNIYTILKREYLRGVIDGQGVKLTPNYTVAELDEIYQEYFKNNPEALDVLDEIIGTNK